MTNAESATFFSGWIMNHVAEIERDMRTVAGLLPAKGATDRQFHEMKTRAEALRVAVLDFYKTQRTKLDVQQA